MGAILVSVLGTLLHFTYEWSGGNGIVAVFSAVNESTWEHLKLLFFPMFLLTMVQLGFLGRQYPNFLAARAVSTLVGLLLIPTLFYTYSGILGYHVEWVNVAIFFLAVLGTFGLDWNLLCSGRFSAPWQQILGLIVLWLLAFCFVWCTVHPVRLALWQDPGGLDFSVSTMESVIADQKT